MLAAARLMPLMPPLILPYFRLIRDTVCCRQRRAIRRAPADAAMTRRCTSQLRFSPLYMLPCRCRALFMRNIFMLLPLPADYFMPCRRVACC